MNSSRLNPHEPPRGSALIITLAALLIVTVLVVAFSVTVRLETTSSKHYYNALRTKLTADMAINEVTAKLSNAIPTDRHWAAAPGKIVAWNGTNWVRTELHSGTNSPYGQVALNAPISGSTNGARTIISPNAEYPDPNDMKVDWINVLQDGTLSTDTNSYLPTKANPLVGRYAYWTDIETGRVNLNTAGWAQTDYTVTSMLPTGEEDLQNLTAHPSRVDLSRLDDHGGAISRSESKETYRHTASSEYQKGIGASGENKLTLASLSGVTLTAANLRQPGEGMKRFRSISEWTEIAGITEDMVEANKFNLTTQARAPELNPWGLNKFWCQLASAKLTNANLNRADHPGLPGYTSQLDFPHTRRGRPDSRDIVYPRMHQSNHLANAQKGNLQSPGSVLTYSDTDANTQYKDGSSFQRYMENMMELLSRFDWPGMPAVSFVDKYGLDNCERMATDLLFMFDSAIGGFGNNYANISGGGLSSTFGANALRYVRADGSIDEIIRNFFPLIPGPLITEVALQFASTAKSRGSEVSIEVPKLDINGNPILGPNGKPVTETAKVDLGKFTKDSNGPAYPYGLYKTGLAQQRAVIQEVGPIAKDANSDDHRNIQITPRYELFYPTSWAHNNAFVAYSGGYKASGGFACIEVNAKGKYQGLDVTYGCEGQASPQPTWEKAAGVTASQYTWGYPDRNGNTLMNWWSYSGLKVDATQSGALPNDSLRDNHALPPLVVGPFDKDEPVEIEVKFRVWTKMMNIWTGTFPLQYLPCQSDITNDPDDPANPSKFTYKVTFTPDGTSGPAPNVSLELIDPRQFHHLAGWQPSEDPTGNTLSRENSVAVAADSFIDPVSGLTGDSSKLIWPNIGAAARRQNLNWGGMPYAAPSAANIVGWPGIGWLSALSTSTESMLPTSEGKIIPWRTVNFGPATNANQLPDWLLLDVFATAYDQTYLSQTQGKVNANAEIYPFGFNRLAPLKALFVPAENASINEAALTQAVAERKNITTGPGVNLPNDVIVYAGQLCQIPEMQGSGTNQFQREAMMRDIAGLITTQCSDFRVYAVAQTLAPDLQNPAQPGKVLSEQRIEAVVSRETDVGPDGIPETADDMAGPDGIVGTADDLRFKDVSGNAITANNGLLRYNKTDPDLEGHAGRPPFRYQVTQFRTLNR